MLHAAEGRLDARAGVNYRLLGAQLAAQGGRIAEVLELEDPEATRARARRLLEDPGSQALGLVLEGSAELRRGCRLRTTGFPQWATTWPSAPSIPPSPRKASSESRPDVPTRGPRSTIR